ncbi:MAG: GNAT family N-acetyltransferase [Motiliproteus sp.]
MALIIRKYTDTDLNAVLSSWENGSRLAHPFLTEAFVEKVRHDIPNLYLPNAETWVADIDGIVVGFIALVFYLKDDKNCNEVGALFVEPEFHGQGIGKALMDKAHGIHGELEVEVFKQNPVGRRFYDRYGFKCLNESIHPETGLPVLRLVLR